MENLLKNTTLSQIRTLQHVVILKDTAAVEQVLKVLASHRLVSAPVVRDLETEPHHGPTWPMNQKPIEVAGFVDVKGIIRKFLEDIKSTGILEMRSMLRRMRALEQQGTIFCKKTISEHGLLNGDGSFLHVDRESLSLLELASEALLGTGKRSVSTTDVPNIVHRIAIFDSNSRISNIISQSDIVRFLFQNSEALGEIGEKTVGELGFGRIKIVSVHPELSAIEALQVLNEKRIGAVAVTNNAGKIIGNFSAADMRTITPEHFGSLALPVGEFLALEHGVEYAGYAIQRGSSMDSATSGNDSSERNIIGRRKSVDFLEARSPSGTNSEKAVLQFARNLNQRGLAIGSDVGQNLIVCDLDNTLIDVMRLLSESRVHRVFIVDDEEKPIGVITCTDILRKLLDLCQ